MLVLRAVLRWGGDENTHWTAEGSGDLLQGIAWGKQGRTTLPGAPRGFSPSVAAASPSYLIIAPSFELRWTD